MSIPVLTSPMGPLLSAIDSVESACDLIDEGVFSPIMWDSVDFGFAIMVEQYGTE